MKILYISTSLGLGGAEKVVTSLADEMVKRKHTVKIAYLTGDAIVKPYSKDIEVIYLGFESLFSVYRAWKNIKNLINNYQPDVVHSHMIHANIFSRIIRLTINFKKLICTAHSSNEGGKLRMLMYRYTNFLSDLDTNVSIEATKKYIEIGAFTKKALTVYNGINLNSFKKLDTLSLQKDNIRSILAVGRLTDAKDYPNLLHAINKLKKIYNNPIKLDIVGDGALEGKIFSLIKELNLSNNVRLLGRRNDIMHLMSEAEIFVLSSSYEGLPTVVIEAMACECFVVATDCGGVREIMGDTGIIVPARNPQELANAIHEALILEEEKLKLNRQNALLHLQENFELENISRKWLKLYENI